MQVTVLGNFGLETTSMSPFFQETGRWYEYFSGDSLEVANILDPITLEPGEYRMYTSERLAPPDFTLDVNRPEPYGPEFNVVIYPNPSSEDFHIHISNTGKEDLAVEIMDISGRIIRRITDGIGMPGNQLLTWDGHADSGRPVSKGLYFLRISSSKTTRTFKILKQ
jgi:hypothetical protein